MKLQTNILLQDLSKGELTILTAEVKETLDRNFRKAGKKVFSAAQLWDIRRRKRPILKMYF